jgi:hypothetical protein
VLGWSILVGQTVRGVAAKAVLLVLRSCPASASWRHQTGKSVMTRLAVLLVLFLSGPAFADPPYQYPGPTDSAQILAATRIAAS